MKLLKTALHFVQTLHRVVKLLEPWGVLLAVCGFGFTLWAFQIDRADREEDRINRAIGQFADGIGRVDALNVLLRNGIDLRALRAEEAYLPEVDLSEVDLSGADLSKTDLTGADLLGTDLSGANLTEANLWRANFAGANLSFANLSGAYLLVAGLAEADLVGADLTGANLTGADLTGANFKRANLTVADLSETRGLEKAMFCSTTTPTGNICNRNCERGTTACPWLETVGDSGPTP